MSEREQLFPLTRCRFGVARRDVTPPVGIYTRSWGAATHEVAEGVHRPFTATAAVFAPLAGEGRALALVALDIGWFQHLADERVLRRSVLERTGLDDAELLIQMSHTHAGANTNSRLGGKPGTELIAPYLDRLAVSIGDAVLEARLALRPAFVSYGTGRCGLAANRDLWDPEAGRFACGYNPDAPADDTVLVARVTGDDGAMLATLCNYACHPTTLAWENRLLSPDFVGAAREVLETAFGAPALFLQGASGELAPRDDYVGDVEIADRNGRQLGHAAAAAVEALPPAGARFVYTGIVASGANLGTWEYRPCEPGQLARAEVLERVLTHVKLERKGDLGVVESISSSAPDSPQEREKALRRELLRLALGDEPVHAMPLWAWRLGEALLVALPNEPYSDFQTELRTRFPGVPLLVLMTTNGGVGYLPPRHTYGTGRYQEQQSPFAPGCLEQTIEAAAETLADL
ncbi:MAG: neutral/alkaline non-lysosomal ceramidase N-terminal domain-containing protein [Gaiella sp.]